MITIRQAVDRVKSGYSKGVSSSNVRVSNRLAYSKLVTMANMMTSQMLSKGRPVSEFHYIYLDCIKMQCSEVHECDCLPTLGKKYWKSVEPLPEILNSNRGLAINYVSTVDGQDQYTKDTFDNIKYLEGNAYTSKAPRWFIKSNHLYVLQEKNRKVLSISALFTDPIEAYTHNNQCGTVEICNVFDLPFNVIESHRVDELIKLTVAELLNIGNSTLEDVTNNARESHPQKSQ